MKLLIPLDSQSTCNLLHLRSSGQNNAWLSTHHRLRHITEIDTELLLDTNGGNCSTDKCERDNSGVVDLTVSDEDDESNEEQISTTASRNDSSDEVPLQPRSSYLFPPKSAAYDVEAVSPALLEFAQFAFGPHGLKHLRVLASGDFSSHGRWAEYCTLLCRKPTSEWGGSEEATPLMRARTFRRVSREDWVLKDYIFSKMEMLSACPSEVTRVQ